MKVDYLMRLILATACSLFGISHGLYYYGYNYRPKNYLSLQQVESGPNQKRYYSTSNYGLSAGWYRNRQDYWKAHKKMYGYQEGMESTTAMSTEFPSLMSTPYPTQDGLGGVTLDQPFPSTVQPVSQEVQPVSQEVQPPYMSQYPEAGILQPQPTDISSSSVMSVPLAPATQEAVPIATSSTLLQSSSLQSTQPETKTSPQPQQLALATFPQPTESHLLPTSSSGSKLVTNAEFTERNSSRICNPGPPLKPNPRLKNCLVIGDSIALGYLKSVKILLSNKCQVQHAPFARGSGAMDSRHGLNCLSLLLKTTAMEPTTYDAIVFNFGMHDIDYSKRFPEEHIPFEEYKDNLLKLKKSFLNTGAKVSFALTTPFPSNKQRNERIKMFNAEAVRIMESGHRIPVVDLYDLVVKRCGKPIYDSCSIMRGPRDVHYNEEGNQLLGVRVAATLATLLDQGPPRKHPPPKKIVQRYFSKQGFTQYYIPDDAITCPDAVTRCPLGTTCCESLISLTGYGCCMIPDAVNCPDNWHCCPRGSACSPTCSVRECKCIEYTTSTNGTKISQNSKAKVKYVAEANLLNGGREEKLGKNFKPIVDPLLRVLKKLASAHKTSSHHPKKMAQLWKNKLFGYKDKLTFTNIKSSNQMHHQSTVHRLNPMNVELAHLIEHHHRKSYKDLKKLLKKRVNLGRTSSHVKTKIKHSHLKHRDFKEKGTRKKPVKPVIHVRGKFHSKQHKKVLDKKEHYLHQKPLSGFNNSHNLHEEYNVSRKKQNKTKHGPSKSYVDHDHQRNLSTANQGHQKAANQGHQKATNQINYSEAYHDRNTASNHSKSFEFEFQGDRKKIMENSTDISHVTRSKHDKQSHDSIIRVSTNITSVKNNKSMLVHPHTFKDDHLSSGENSGSGVVSGLREVNNYDFDGDEEEEISGSGLRDDSPTPVNPYHRKELEERELKPSEIVPSSTIKNTVKGYSSEQDYSTIQSSKTAHNNSSISKTIQVSGSETRLQKVLLSDSQRSNAMRDSFDDLNPTDSEPTREASWDSDTSGTSGEFVGKNSDKSVKDTDEHEFDLMSSALMENDGAKNDIIQEEQGAGKRQYVTNSFDGQNSELVGSSKTTASIFESKENKGKSYLIVGEESEGDIDDDIRGNNDKIKLNAEHNMNKPPMEDRDEVDIDLEDSSNLVSLDSLLEDNSGDSNETQAKSLTTSSSPQKYTKQRTPMIEEETGLVEKESVGYEYPDGTHELQQSAIMEPKTNLVEISATANLMQGTKIMRQKANLVENPMDNPATQMPKNSVKSSDKVLTIADATKAPQNKGGNLTVFQRNRLTKSHSKFISLEHQYQILTNPKKKKEPKNTSTKKSWKSAGKVPTSNEENSLQNKIKVDLNNQERGKVKSSTHLGLNGSSEGNGIIKSAASLSLHVNGKERHYQKENKLLQKDSKEVKNKKRTRQSVIGETDDISNEDVDDHKTSVPQGESGRAMLEAYLATP